MARPGGTLWMDVDALRRLARTERRFAGGPEAHAFPPISERSEFAVHTVEAPKTLACGDFCDALLIAPETLAIVIADVSGKGVAAAMVRGVAHSVVRNIAPVSPSPASLLARLDQILTEAELGSMFLTAFVGWYDTASGVLCYANAGHPAPYRITVPGEVVPFHGANVTSPIVGILGGQRYTDCEGRLEIGERLVLYTDGVTDAENERGESFGTLRLTDTLAEHARASSADLCRHVVERVRRFERQRKQDDVSLLVLERRR